MLKSETISPTILREIVNSFTRREIEDSTETIETLLDEIEATHNVAAEACERRDHRGHSNALIKVALLCDRLRDYYVLCEIIRDVIEQAEDGDPRSIHAIGGTHVRSMSRAAGSVFSWLKHSNLEGVQYKSDLSDGLTLPDPDPDPDDE